MKRLINFFGSKTGTLLLFHLGLLLFSWPLMSITANMGGVALFRYLFLAWAVFIAILPLMAYAVRRNSSDKGEE